VAGLGESVNPVGPYLQHRRAESMFADLEKRRRRAAYRARHRGTKEMDWLLGQYAEAHVVGMDTEALARFERLLAMPDPDIRQWILNPETLGEADLAGLIAALRLFHNLGMAAGDAANSRS
jgi:antitoxin CptB